MIEIFYHVNLFDSFQTLVVRHPDKHEQYVVVVFPDVASYLAEYIIQDDKEYKIYLSGLPEHNLITIKEQILEEISIYYTKEYTGVEIEII